MSSYPRPSVGSTPRVSHGTGRASRVSIGNQPINQNQNSTQSQLQPTPKHNLPPLTSFGGLTPSRYHSLSNHKKHSVFKSSHQEDTGTQVDQTENLHTGNGNGNGDFSKINNNNNYSLFNIVPESKDLPSGKDLDPPSLGFEESNLQLDNFFEGFSLRIREIGKDWESKKDDFKNGKDENQLKVKELVEDKVGIEKDIDREWDAIKQEQHSDSNLRQKLSSLNSNHNSLDQRLKETKNELEELKRILSKKVQEKELETKNYKKQVEKNKPELESLAHLTGCKIIGTKGADQIEFRFSLINSQAYDQISSVTLDVSSKIYAIATHSNDLKDEILIQWLKELNQDRNLYRFIKKIREGLRREFDSRRLKR